MTHFLRELLKQLEQQKIDKVTFGYSLACHIYYRQNLTISVTIGLRITISYITKMLQTLK
jgi:ribosomal 50S subunit-associated protein YjgA (DUF615 family)